jgi:hypothetical protein
MTYAIGVNDQRWSQASMGAQIVDWLGDFQSEDGCGELIFRSSDLDNAA